MPILGFIYKFSIWAGSVGQLGSLAEAEVSIFKWFMHMSGKLVLAVAES